MMSDPSSPLNNQPDFLRSISLPEFTTESGKPAHPDGRPKSRRSRLATAIKPVPFFMHMSKRREMRMSESLPAIESRPAADRRKQVPTIHGGLHFKHLQKEKKAEMPTRYMEWLNKHKEKNEGDAKQERRKAALKAVMRRNQMYFSHADEDCDGLLNFEEFCRLRKAQFRPRMQKAEKAREQHKADGKGSKAPPRLLEPSRLMLRDLFYSIDVDRDGTISLSEYFAFSLRETLRRSDDEGEEGVAGAFEAFICMWDQDGETTMSVEEISCVAKSLGFESVTQELLKQCAEDKANKGKDGQVLLSKFLEAFQTRTNIAAGGAKAKKFVESSQHVAGHPAASNDKLVGSALKLAADRRLHAQSLKAVFRSQTRAIQLTAMMQSKSSGAPAGLPVPSPIKTSSIKKRKPQIDMGSLMVLNTLLAHLDKLDQQARLDPFYDPATSALATQRFEMLERAMKLLRSWLRKSGFTALDLFQTWDYSDNYELSRREMQVGLADLGVSMTMELLESIFDTIAKGIHMRYNEFRRWYETTDRDPASQEEAASVVQKMYRGHLIRKVQEGKLSPDSPSLKQPWMKLDPEVLERMPPVTTLPRQELISALDHTTKGPEGVAKEEEYEGIESEEEVRKQLEEAAAAQAAEEEKERRELAHMMK